MAYVGHDMLLSRMAIARIYVVGASVGLFISPSYYKRKCGLEKTEVVIIHLLGVGPLITGIYLWLNVCLASPSREVEFSLWNYVYDNHYVYVRVNNEEFNKYYPELLRFDLYYLPEISQATTIRVEIYKSFIGIEFVKRWHFIEGKEAKK